MAFGHPDQHQHMMSGVQKAFSSPRTPAHLKPHLQKRLQGRAMKHAGGVKTKAFRGSKTGRQPMMGDATVAARPASTVNNPDAAAARMVGGGNMNPNDSAVDMPELEAPLSAGMSGTLPNRRPFPKGKKAKKGNAMTNAFYGQ